MRNIKRNAAIASAAVVAIGLVGFEIAGRASMSNTCREARQVRQEIAGSMGSSIGRGYSDLAAQYSALLQDANDLIAKCNVKGF